MCVVPVSVWVDLSYGSADRDRCPLSIPIIHTVPPLNSNLLTSHPKTLSGHTETLNWAKLWEWGASWRWPETHSIKKATSLVSHLGPLLHFSCHFFAVCYLIKAIHQAVWDTKYICVCVCVRRHVKSRKGKRSKQASRLEEAGILRSTLACPSDCVSEWQTVSWEQCEALITASTDTRWHVRRRRIE